MYELYTTLIYQPIFNVLVFIYNTLPNHDMGLSIIILTVLIKVVLHPLTHKQLMAQRSMQEMQPKLNALKAKYKDDKQGMMQEQMKLFKEHKVNPLASCLPVLVQLPVLIAVYRVFFSGLNTESLKYVYIFVGNPGQLNTTFLGLFSLDAHNIPLAVIAAGLQFIQAKMMMTKRPPKVPGAKDEDFAAIMSQQMLLIMPIITLLIGSRLPAGVVLYWTIYNFITIVQQYIALKTPLSKPGTPSTPDVITIEAPKV